MGEAQVPSSQQRSASPLQALVSPCWHSQPTEGRDGSVQSRPPASLHSPEQQSAPEEQDSPGPAQLWPAVALRAPTREPPRIAPTIPLSTPRRDGPVASARLNASKRWGSTGASLRLYGLSRKTMW